MSDEGFREIQLNGKQLIFLFMAVTVVSVVIFLFGVLVGRGVREGAATTEIASGEVAPDSGVMSPADNGGSTQLATAGNTPNQAPPAPATEELSYAERLLRDNPPEEKLKSSTPPEPAAAPAPVVQEPVVKRAPPPAPEEKAPASAPAAPAPRAAQPSPASASASMPSAQASDPAGPGYAVQVSAHKDRKEADAVAQRLAAKGYPAFVMAPAKGTPTQFFRVRVGKYKTLKDAEAIASRLQTAEQLPSAWIAR